MKLATLPLDAAEGGLLAHALRRPGLALPKGRRLEATDLARLAEVGVDRVTVAIAEADDVGETVAAARIGAALAGFGIVPEAARDGRCDLTAAAPGLVVFDAAAVHALNRIDEAVTIATLPVDHAVDQGTVVATIKVNPYCVAADLVARWERGAGLFRLAPFRPLAAALVQTATPETKPTVLDRAAASVATRLGRLGGRLASERRVPHDVASLAAAVEAATAEGCDLVLVCGATSVCDRADVVPAAIEAAGGTIVRFGMPVEPGNLLVVARLAETTIVGMPGCARSIAPNGLDLVLPRLAAGLPVDGDTIAAMGVGGLLRGRGANPRPQAETAPDRPKRVAAIVLAAGGSRRMGANKLVLDLEGRPLVRHAIEAIGASDVSRTIVVLGNEAERVRAAVGEGRPDLTFVENPDWRDGLATSLRRGIAALPPDVDAAMVFLGDMPDVDAATIDRIVAAHAPDEMRAIVVPRRAGRRGHPVLWDRAFFDLLATECEGDTGARHLIGRFAEQVAEVDVDHDGVLLDLDTPDALEARRAEAAARRQGSRRALVASRRSDGENGESSADSAALLVDRRGRVCSSLPIGK